MRERKELDFLRIVVKDASSLAKQVSLLNFEPRSRSFLGIVARRVATIPLTTMESLFCWMCVYERALEIRLPLYTTIGSLFFLIFLANVFKMNKIMV